jgi:hypothetical protein
VSDRPRISFGIIVLNGEPFTRYCLRALYPFAHEILVVEGACPAAAAVATADGHSTDGTVEAIRAFQRDEDPEGKVQLVQRDGFWDEKDEQSRAYAERATGDWLWQVDVDEFYLPRDLEAVCDLLRREPDTTAVSFHQIAFWGSPDYVVDGWYLRRGADEYHRLFRWGPGHRYATHRPPTVVDADGRDLRTRRRVRGRRLARQGIHLLHYSLLFPKQVREKCAYYAAGDQFARPHAEAWARECFERLDRPYRVHNVYEQPSWLARYEGEHPPAIHQLMGDVEAGRLDVERRPCDDVERLLASPRYRLGRAALKALQPLDALAWRFAPWLRRLGRFAPRRLPGVPGFRPGSERRGG